MYMTGPFLGVTSDAGYTCDWWNSITTDGAERLTSCEGAPGAVNLDIGAYTSTNTQGNTRGYWVTAPIGFRIVELKVPTDVGDGVQNIEVIRFNSTPTPTAATSDFVSLGRWVGVESDSVICDIVVNAGETIGVLGARGTDTMSNSYGQMSMYATTIHGEPAQLGRLQYQDNLYKSSPTSGDVVEVTPNNSSQVSRVETRYR
jgi:hypothetical protein